MSIKRLGTMFKTSEFRFKYHLNDFLAAKEDDINGYVFVVSDETDISVMNVYQCDTETDTKIFRRFMKGGEVFMKKGGIWEPGR